MQPFLCYCEHFRFPALLSLTLLFCFDQVQSQSPLSGLPYVRNFDAKDYSAGLQNFNIKEDRRGILYVANNYGLLEFDGVKWQIYGVKSGTKVRSIAIDGRGRIYVGCQGDFGYFFPDAKGQLTYISLADSLESRYRNFEETWNIYTDHEKVYFCTFSNLFIYDGKALHVIAPSRPLDHSYLVNRELFVNEREQGIVKLENNALVPIHGGHFFKGMSVSSILSMPNGHHLLSTFQHGIFRLINGSAEPWNKSNQQFFKAANINCMLRLKNGQFAVGTQNEGLLILDLNGNILLQLTRDKGLENRTVLNLYEDDQQYLWVGQNNSIAYVALGSSFSFIKEQSGLPGIGYAAYLDGDQFYLGTNTGLYHKKLNEKVGFELVQNSQGQIYSLGRYSTEILVGHQEGAMRLEGNRAVPISREPGSWIFLPLKNNPDKLLEGTFTGIQLYRLEGSHWKLKKKLKGFSESSRVMAEDMAGRIWVTHGYKGAYQITLNEARDSILKVSFYGSEKGFPTNHLINVFKVRNELLFTSESGTYKYHPPTDRFIADGLFSELLGQGSQLWSIQEDAIGNIYFIGREHLGVLRKNAVGDYVLFESEFNKIRKFLNDDLQNITIMSNNEVLYAAKDGFIHFDPKVVPNQKTKFTILIRQVSTRTPTGRDSVLFSGQYSLQDSVIARQLKALKPKLTYETNNVNFTFAAPSYDSENDDLSYQYYLENFEKGWSVWHIQSQKEYTNLKENKYIFHVRAKNIKGEISNEASYEFRVGPPWYRSLLAYSFYTVMVISSFLSSYKLVSRKYKKQERLMVVKQKRELNKKDNEMEKLSFESRDEISRLQNEKLEAEINHTKNELATATMHLLNKNEFISGIKVSLTKIVSKYDQDTLTTELEKINKEIEGNISQDNDWEHFQFHFDRVHGNFTSRLKERFTSLSPQETKLCAYLRMNLSSKEIAQLLNISVRGVEIGRYRLRKKLQLEREKNLQEFILNF